jgi:hypothetical protein
VERSDTHQLLLMDRWVSRRTQPILRAEQFDAAIERDARAGKLDAHAEEGLAAHRAGRSREV